MIRVRIFSVIFLVGAFLLFSNPVHAQTGILVDEILNEAGQEAIQGVQDYFGGGNGGAQAPEGGQGGQSGTPNGQAVTENPSNFIGQLFTLVIGLAGVIAVLKIVIAGFQYVTARDNPSAIDAAKGKIQAAVFGLLLALGSYLILNTINPELVKFELKLEPLQRSAVQDRTVFSLLGDFVVAHCFADSSDVTKTDCRLTLSDCNAAPRQSNCNVQICAQETRSVDNEAEEAETVWSCVPNYGKCENCDAAKKFIPGNTASDCGRFGGNQIYECFVEKEFGGELAKLASLATGASVPWRATELWPADPEKYQDECRKGGWCGNAKLVGRGYPETNDTFAELFRSTRSADVAIARDIIRAIENIFSKTLDKDGNVALRAYFEVADQATAEEIVERSVSAQIELTRNDIIVNPDVINPGFFFCYGHKNCPTKLPGSSPEAGRTPETATGEELAYRQRLEAAGITIWSSDGRTGNNSCTEAQMKEAAPKCTNVAGLPATTIDAIIALKQSCGGSSCSVTVTGGTEPGHITHGVGKPVVDFAKSRVGLDDYIKLGVVRTRAEYPCGLKTATRYVISNDVFVDEGGHWHVCFNGSGTEE